MVHGIGLLGGSGVRPGGSWSDGWSRVIQGGGGSVQSSPVFHGLGEGQVMASGGAWSGGGGGQRTDGLQLGESDPKWTP